MATAYFITHPDVLIDPAKPVTEWTLSKRGRQRMVTALSMPWVPGLRTIWSSTEHKSRDGAAILADHLGLAVHLSAALGENDRSATGYLPPQEFEAVANEFFSHPTTSVRGWETASNAQRRIIDAADNAIASSDEGYIAIIAHGGVGALLLCHLMGVAISRTYDQPATNGGNYFAFDTKTQALRHAWRPIDP